MDSNSILSIVLSKAATEGNDIWMQAGVAVLALVAGIAALVVRKVRSVFLDLLSKSRATCE